MRVLANGDLLFVPVSRSPHEINGYETVPGEPGRFRPILEGCSEREYYTTEGCCKRIIKHMRCSIIDREVSRLTCLQCKGNTQWIKMI